MFGVEMRTCAPADQYAEAVGTGIEVGGEISADDIAKSLSQLKTDDVLGRKFLLYRRVCRSYSASRIHDACHEQGARLWRGTEVTGVSTDGTAWPLLPRHATIATRGVVNAAGAWAASDCEDGWHRSACVRYGVLLVPDERSVLSAQRADDH